MKYRARKYNNPRYSGPSAAATLTSSRACSGRYVPFGNGIKMKRFTALAISLSLVGCGITTKQFYEGPPLSNSQTAIFSMWIDNPEYRGDFFPADLKINSESINGTPFETNSQVSVLPGQYSFKVKCDYKGAIKHHVYDIDAEAGKNYAVIVFAKDNECQFKNLNLLINNERFEEL